MSSEPMQLGRTNHFDWSRRGDEAFRTLKEKFPLALVITLPDPKLQFVVEVDASDVGVGVVLSQRSVSDGRLHSCAFLSRKVNPVERLTSAIESF